MEISDLILALGGYGILTPKDLEDFNDAEMRVLHLMVDWDWHSAQDIIDVSQQREGLRRMRVLRDKFEISVKRVGTARDFHYKLERPPDQDLQRAQGRLF